MCFEEQASVGWAPSMLSLNFHVFTNVGVLYLVTLADSMNASLGMGLSITSKLD